MPRLVCSIFDRVNTLRFIAPTAGKSECPVEETEFEQSAGGNRLGFVARVYGPQDGVRRVLPCMRQSERQRQPAFALERQRRLGNAKAS